MMIVRWSQGGVLIEPESPVETEALLILTRTLRIQIPEEDDHPKPPSANDPRSGSCGAGEAGEAFGL